MSPPARLRDHEVLEMQLAALAGEGGQCGEGDPLGFRRGAVDALRWVTEGGPGPLTDCLEGLRHSMRPAGTHRRGRQAGPPQWLD